MLIRSNPSQRPTPRTLYAGLAAAVLLAAANHARAADPTLFPAPGAKDIPPDVQLKIQFPSAPTLGAGKIQIFDSATNTLVEAIDVATPTLSQPMAGMQQKYYPVTITGNEATIHPKLHELAYGKSYYATVDAGAFKFAADSSTSIDISAWQFSTRAAAPKPTSKITIAPDDSGDFCTLQAALDFIPDNNTARTSIFLKKGTYTEMIFLRGKNNITLIGEDRKNSVIAYSNTAPLNGRRSVMQINNCNDFVMANLTVWDTTPRLSGGNQAETIIYGGNLNSRAVLNKVDLKSFQDTLQINDQAFLSDCTIEGDIDFMWGSGCVFFDNITAKMLTGGNDSYVETRTPATNHGFVYYHSTFTSVPGITGNYIAQSAGSAEVVLLDCTLGDNIRPIGWRVNAAGGGGARGGAPGGRGAGGRGAGGRGAPTVPTGTPPTVPAAAPAAGGRGRGGPGGGGGIKYLEFDSHTPDGKPVDISQRAPESKQLTQPADADTIANYSNPVWVLGNTWVPMVPANNPRPTTASIKLNAPLNFSPTFNFSPDATYQWQKDGANIPNATAALYQIKGATAADAGTYTLIIKTGPDTVTSARATVKIAE